MILFVDQKIRKLRVKETLFCNSFPFKLNFLRWYKILFLIFLFIFLVRTSSAQSDYARKIADSFIGTEYESYTQDILVNKPDYVVFVPKRKKQIIGDTYNDHFQVFTKPNGMLFAVWTQATREGDIDQHIAFSKSMDSGLREFFN